MTVGITTG